MQALLFKFWINTLFTKHDAPTRCPASCNRRRRGGAPALRMARQRVFSEPRTDLHSACQQHSPNPPTFSMSEGFPGVGRCDLAVGGVGSSALANRLSIAVGLSLYCPQRGRPARLPRHGQVAAEGWQQRGAAAGGLRCAARHRRSAAGGRRRQPAASGEPPPPAAAAASCRCWSAGCWCRASAMSMSVLLGACMSASPSTLFLTCLAARLIAGRGRDRQQQPAAECAAAGAGGRAGGNAAQHEQHAVGQVQPPAGRAGGCV